MVLDNRPSDINTELVSLRQRPLLSAGVQQKAVGVQDTILDVFVNIAMKLISSILCNHREVDHATVAGIHVDAANLDFLQRTERRKVDTAQTERVGTAAIA